MIDDRYLLVRAAAVYVTALLTAAAVLWRRPDQRTLAGALLAFAWNLPALLMVHVAAIAAGWWSYDADGGLLLGMPVDLWLAWAVLWGRGAGHRDAARAALGDRRAGAARRSHRDARGGAGGAARAVVADWGMRQHPVVPGAGAAAGALDEHRSASRRPRVAAGGGVQRPARLAHPADRD